MGGHGSDIFLGVGAAGEDARRTAAETAALPALTDFFGYRFSLGEEIQIIGTAGFGIGARHVKAAEGVCADHRAVHLRFM